MTDADARLIQIRNALYLIAGVLAGGFLSLSAVLGGIMGRLL